VFEIKFDWMSLHLSGRNSHWPKHKFCQKIRSAKAGAAPATNLIPYKINNRTTRPSTGVVFGVRSQEWNAMLRFIWDLSMLDAAKNDLKRPLSLKAGGYQRI
jgi:hypothetical protein